MLIAGDRFALGAGIGLLLSSRAHDSARIGHDRQECGGDHAIIRRHLSLAHGPYLLKGEWPKINFDPALRCAGPMSFEATRLAIRNSGSSIKDHNGKTATEGLLFQDDTHRASSSFPEASRSASASSAHAGSASRLCIHRIMSAGSPGRGMGPSSHGILLERSRPHASSASSQRSKRSNSIRLLGSTWRKAGSSSTNPPSDSGTGSRPASQPEQRLACELFVIPQERQTLPGSIVCSPVIVCQLLVRLRWPRRIDALYGELDQIGRDRVTRELRTASRTHWGSGADPRQPEFASWNLE